MAGFFREKINTLKGELSSYSSRERSFIFFAMLCGFCICCEYSLIRPVSNSLFIHNYGAHNLPYAWLSLVPFNILIVSVYNKLLPKWGSKKIFVALLLAVMSFNTLVALTCKRFGFVPFAFYMWKEIYVLMMFQLVWSVIHANIKFSKAKYLYGIIFGVGGLGSLLGVLIPSFFAVATGSENLIFLTSPIYFLLFLVYRKMSSFCKGDVPAADKHEEGGIWHGMKLIRGSRYLLFALCIVCFMQMAAAIVDFQFNDFLGRTFSDKDIRTEYSARIFAIGHFLTISLQFLGTYVLIRVIGYRRSHFLIPLVIGSSAVLFTFFPIFSVASLMLISIKAVDFSVFGAIKEMLYVPLNADEKFRAKAVIDIFAYRTSKAFASIIILLVSHYFSTMALSWLTICIALLWAASISFGLKGYEKLVEAA